MSGKQYLSYFQLGKESVAGTAVAATRQLFPEGTGLLDEDLQLAFNEDSNRGTKVRVTTAISQGMVVGMNYRTAPQTGVAYDELVIPGSQLLGGQTGTGGAADKTWAFIPVAVASSAQESFTIETGDDTQEVEIEYCQARGFELSASRDSMTQLSMDWFGRQVTKSTKTAVSATNPVRIPGYLWTHKFATTQAGLAGASITTNELRSFTLTVDTGLRPHFYLDGNGYFGQSQESGGITATLVLTVDSSAAAITEYYDKFRAQTLSWHRLRATGPTLGGTNYMASFDVCVYYESVQLIGSEQDGVNLYEVTGRMTFDPVSSTSINMNLVNSLAAIP